MEEGAGLGVGLSSCQVEFGGVLGQPCSSAQHTVLGSMLLRLLHDLRLDSRLPTD